MDIFSVLELIGGIGLFLYGMKYLGSSLEQMAGARLEKTLEKMTNNTAKGFSLGVLVTAVIQSSSATTIMLIGFVNAGIMKLPQSIPVLLGANIGTTVTGQILRLGDISSSGSLILQLIKPTSFAPLIIGIAAFMMLMSKKKKVNGIASILMGFGVLFFGMNVMETALEPLKASESFRNMFTTFTNPVVGLLLGLLLAMILQSSSAAVGIVQAVAAATGTVTYAVALPMIVGISIGKIFPIVLASFGIKREAQQVTISQLIISIIGGIGGMLFMYFVMDPLGLIDWNQIMTRGSVANLNTYYNIAISVIFLPLCKPVAKLARKIAPEKQHNKIDEELSLLDDIFLKTPALALEQCSKVINSMGHTALENYEIAIGMHDNFHESDLERLNENEQFLDRAETVLSDYMVKVNACPLQTQDQQTATEIMHSIMDYERIGDHCVKVYEVASFNHEGNITFTDSARKELNLLFDIVHETMRFTVDAMENDDEEMAGHVEPLEELTKAMAEEVKDRHIKRLQSGSCTVQGGISLVECLTSLERIAAYCSNVALHVIQKHAEGDSFDMHSYADWMHTQSAEYKRLYSQYSDKYMKPLQQIIIAPVLKDKTSGK